jgi:hypothetical protein
MTIQKKGKICITKTLQENFHDLVEVSEGRYGVVRRTGLAEQ